MSFKTDTGVWYRQDEYDALAADLADSRLIAREQEDAHVAANLRNTHLQERITQLEAFLNRCYEDSRAPYAEEMDDEHVPMPETDCGHRQVVQTGCPTCEKRLGRVGVELDVDEYNDTAADGEMLLKPCPFCDGEAKIENAAEVGPNSYVVVCQNPQCMSSSQVRVAEKDDVTPLLIEAWNRRGDKIRAQYEESK